MTKQQRQELALKKRQEEADNQRSRSAQPPAALLQGYRWSTHPPHLWLACLLQDRGHEARNDGSAPAARGLSQRFGPSSCCWEAADLQGTVFHSKLAHIPSPLPERNWIPYPAGVLCSWIPPQNNLMAVC